MVIITGKAYAKIFRYARQVGKGEIGGFLLGKIKKNGDSIVTGMMILKQKKSNAAFELDEEALMDFTKNATAKELKSIIGWVHSHGHGTPFWSWDDDATFRRLCNFFGGYCLGIVVAVGNNENYTARVDVKDKKGRNLVINDVMLDIKGPVEKRINVYVHEAQEIDNKIITADPSEVESGDFSTCPTCGGLGIVDKKEGIMEYIFGG